MLALSSATKSSVENVCVARVWREQTALSCERAARLITEPPGFSAGCRALPFAGAHVQGDV